MFFFVCFFYKNSEEKRAVIQTKLLLAEPCQACVSSSGISNNSLPEQLRGRVQLNLEREMVRKVQRSPGR